VRGAIKKDETKADESEPVDAAPMQDVQNAIKYATPIIADIIKNICVNTFD
jgi:hypothetical protein